METTFESLAGENVAVLAQFCEQAGMVIAYPHLTEPIVARVNGQIVGFAFAQLLPHCEPIFVQPEYRGTGIAEELAKRVIEKITETGAKRFCCIAQNAFAEKLCRDNGMREVPGKIFVRED